MMPRNAAAASSEPVASPSSKADTPGCCSSRSPDLQASPASGGSPSEDTRVRAGEGKPTPHGRARRASTRTTTTTAPRSSTRRRAGRTGRASERTRPAVYVPARSPFFCGDLLHHLDFQVAVHHQKRWRTRLELTNAIFEYLEVFHNRRRRHSALGMLTPVEYEARHQQTTAA